MWLVKTQAFPRSPVRQYGEVHEIEIEERDGKQVLKPVRAHTSEPLETTVFRGRIDRCQG